MKMIRLIIGAGVAAGIYFLVKHFVVQENPSKPNETKVNQSISKKEALELMKALKAIKTMKDKIK